MEERYQIQILTSEQVLNPQNDVISTKD
jgi:hypothetical protein